MNNLWKYMLRIQILLPLSIYALLCIILPSLSAMADNSRVHSDCSYKGIRLYGKVQIVQSFPDIKVQVVEAFPDLKVKTVSAFPDACGKWQMVEAFPDFKVQFVESFPDIKIQYTESFPGLP